MRFCAVSALVLLGATVAFAAEKPEKPESDFILQNTLPPSGYFELVFVHRAMGTEFQLIIWGDRAKNKESDLDAVAEEVFKGIDNLESRISEWEQGTQIYLVNKRAAERPVTVAPDVMDMLLTAQRFYRESNGAFDMTVGPLVELWRNALKEKRIPSAEEIASAKELVGFDKVMLDPENRSVRFAKPGMRLTTGGIGKGMAIDKARQTLEFYGITRAIFHGGTSSILALGAPPGEAGWKVVMENPYNSAGALAEVTLCNETMSCSGHVMYMTEIDGKKYGHILNPATGMPVQGMLITVAIGPSGTETDALTKVFFVNGERAAEEYCSRHPEVRAIVVPDTGTEDLVLKRFNFGVK